MKICLALNSYQISKIEQKSALLWDFASRAGHFFSLKWAFLEKGKRNIIVL